MVTAECFAVRWTFFFILATDITFKAYSPLYLQQLGFSSSDVSLTILPASFLALVFIPLIGYIADKYRIRGWILQISIFLTIIVLQAHLLPLIFYKHCEIPSEHLKNITAAENTNWFTQKPTVTPILFTQPAIGNNSSLYNTLDYEQRNWPANNSHVKSTRPPVSILIVMIILRLIYDILNRMLVPLINVAAVQQTREVGTTFGSYRCWGDIGGSLFMFLIGLLVSYITYSICGITYHGYFILFIFNGVQIALALIFTKVIKFQYLTHEVTTLDAIKNALCNKHYIIMMFIACFTGFCLGFQEIWELWYIKELSGTPIVMAVTGLLREPFVALWFFLSGIIINKFGEMKTICLALFLYALSFLALSFIYQPWLVCVFDVLQSAGYAFSNSSLVVHFAKTGTVASLAVIQAILNCLFYGFGLGSGATVMGLLFNIIGSRITLRCYSLAAVLVLVGFGVYVMKSSDYYKYEKAEVFSDSDSDEENDDG